MRSRVNCSVAAHMQFDAQTRLQLQQLLSQMRGGIQWRSSSGSGWLPLHFISKHTPERLPSCPPSPPPAPLVHIMQQAR